MDTRTKTRVTPSSLSLSHRQICPFHSTAPLFPRKGAILPDVVQLVGSGVLKLHERGVGVLSFARQAVLSALERSWGTSTGPRETHIKGGGTPSDPPLNNKSSGLNSFAEGMAQKKSKLE